MAKFGKYLVNPVPYLAIVANPKKRRGKKVKMKRNPKKKRAKKRPAPAPLPKISSAQPQTQMKSKRRRRRKSRSFFGKRNPVRRSRRRRSSSRRVRNPISSNIREMFSPNMLTLAGGVVIGNVGTAMIINRLVAPPAGSTRPFDLPGVDYTVASAEFYTKNAVALAFYKLAIGIAASYLLRNQSPRLSQGLAIGSVAGAINDVLKKTGVITPTGTIAGVGRNFSARGAGYLPGTNTRFTGPAQRFLSPTNGVPRPGMGAAVRRGFTERTAAKAESAFGSAN